MRRFSTIILLFVICLIKSSPIFALEADQYIIWEQQHGLKDSTNNTNILLNRFLEEYLNHHVNLARHAHKPRACEKVASGFLKFLRPNFFVDRLKSSLLADKDVEKFPKKSRPFYDYPRSIYQGFQWPFIMPVAQNIKINGVFTGTDKIDHFFSSGRRYHKVYLHALKKGSSKEEALKKALDFGLSAMEEKGVLGYWSSGAFSYADIAANYQGMRLAIDMCDCKKPIIKHMGSHRGWVVNRPVEIRDYVNPLWDEAFNNSYYFKYRWHGVKKVLQSKYCSMGLNHRVQALWKTYQQKLKPDFATDHIKELIRIGKAPNPRPQSLHEACEYPSGVMEGNMLWEK